MFFFLVSTLQNRFTPKLPLHSTNNQIHEFQVPRYSANGHTGITNEAIIHQTLETIKTLAAIITRELFSG